MRELQTDLQAAGHDLAGLVPLSLMERKLLRLRATPRWSGGRSEVCSLEEPGENWNRKQRIEPQPLAMDEQLIEKQFLELYQER